MPAVRIEAADLMYERREGKGTCSSSLDAYIEQRKEGQNQIFFLTNGSQTIDNLKDSAMVEKLTARGRFSCIGPLEHK
jgi:HSP90 family molecular chaperone